MEPKQTVHLKDLLLLVVQAYEQLGAVTFYLAKKGLIEPKAFAEAMEEAKNHYAECRKSIEALKTEPDEAYWRSLLQSFEGPIQ